MKIQPIVEGYGEVQALPVLLRRLRNEAGAWEVEIESPIRRHRDELVSEPGVKKAVEIARRQRPEAILIVFDGDDDCPAELGCRVRGWARAAAGKLPCEVVLPHREYEAWFLAAIESLTTHKLIRTDAVSCPDPEQRRGAKKYLGRQMIVGTKYAETTHQAAFSASFCLELAYRRSRSFRKLTTSFGSLLVEVGQDIGTWPPERWLDG